MCHNAIVFFFGIFHQPYFGFKHLWINKSLNEHWTNRNTIRMDFKAYKKTRFVACLDNIKVFVFYTNSCTCCNIVASPHCTRQTSAGIHAYHTTRLRTMRARMGLLSLRDRERCQKWLTMSYRRADWLTAPVFSSTFFVSTQQTSSANYAQFALFLQRKSDVETMKEKN